LKIRHGGNGLSVGYSPAFFKDGEPEDTIHGSRVQPIFDTAGVQTTGAFPTHLSSAVCADIHAGKTLGASASFSLDMGFSAGLILAMRENFRPIREFSP
jgi:hypothetical protein